VNTYSQTGKKEGVLSAQGMNGEAALPDVHMQDVLIH